MWTEKEASKLMVLQEKHGKTLKERVAEYDIPDVPLEPVGMQVVVFRLPQVAHKTEGGVILPDFALAHDKDAQTTVDASMPVSLGVLLAAGLEARDYLLSHGTFVGDIVKFTQYAGHEEQSHRFLASKKTVKNVKQFLQIPAREVIGSLDLRERVWGKGAVLEVRYRVRQDGKGMHVYVPKEAR